MTNQHRRRQYMINKPFQYKMIIYLALLVVAAVIIAHGIAIGYATIMGTDQASEQISQVTKNATGLTLSLDSLWLPILITTILGIIFVLVFGLFYSHRIAGPLFNLKRVMDRVGRGDLSTMMHIRSTDEFHDVQDTFNQMVEALNVKITNLRQGIQSLPDKEKRRLESLLNENFTLHNQ